MSDITKSTGFVSLDKDGHLSIDGVKLNIRELLNTIDQKPSTYIQVEAPTKYSILDWWYNPDDGVLCMAVFLDNKIAWKETTFGTNSLLKNVTTGTEITATMLNNIMNDFYAKVNEIGIKLVNGEVIKNDGNLTNGEIAYRKTKVINYIYNGALDLPPVMQTGGKMWNSAKNGFCLTDYFGGGFYAISAINTCNCDSNYNYKNKTYTINIKDKTVAADNFIYLPGNNGKTALELIGQDLVFSMDVDVTKACTIALTFEILHTDLGLVYNQTPKVFNLTPGRKIEKCTFTLNDNVTLKNITSGLNKLYIAPKLYIENTAAGSKDNMPAITLVENNTFTFYGFKLNKGSVILDNVSDDFRNMFFYKQLFPKRTINTVQNSMAPQVKADFSANWVIPAWCTVTTYKTILNDSTAFSSRDAESQEILTAMGYYGIKDFETDIVIKKIVWTARDDWALPYFRLLGNYSGLFTLGAFVKLNKGTLRQGYTHGAELGKWKLCGFTGHTNVYGWYHTHPYDNNNTGTGGGEILIAMAGAVEGHVDLSNPTNWRLF